MTTVRRVHAVIAAGFFVVSLVSAAAAQVFEPYVAAVSGEATVRSGARDQFYAVGTARPGQVVRVESEADGWAKVTYPAGLTALAPASDVTVDAAGKTVTVNKPTKLRAANAANGPKGSWKPLLDGALPAGTKLTLAGTLPVDDGRGNLFYSIVPPAGARAFIPSGALRRATNEETLAFNAANPGGTTGLTPTKPESTNAGVNPATGPATSPATPAQPVVIDVKPAPPLPPDPNADRIRKLESAFDSVRKQPAAEAEYNELIAEFQKSMNEQESTPEGEALKQRLGQRVELLKIKADVQAQLRKIAEARGSLSERDKRLAERLADLEKVRQYAVVGRLSASTIYDGQRLPLMYRVQSIGGASPRTIGYIKPDEAMKLDAKLGSIIGVVGESEVDGSLKLNIITARRVDVLEAMPTASADPGEGG